MSYQPFWRRAWQRLRQLPISRFVDIFAVMNLAFLGLDILIAHRANHFERWEEWLPIGFSILAPLALLPTLLGSRYRSLGRPSSLVVGAASVALGVLGMLFHLESSFFERQTLHDLVYAAPFVAPLSYVGVGLLVLLNRLEATETLAWSRWVLFLALGGFVGNLGLSLLDHAQNGFFHGSEWLSVVAASFGVAFSLCVVVRPSDALLRRCCAWVMAGEAAIGMLGFGLHLHADWFSRATSTVNDRFVYGAPVLAPLLFTNLAVLAGLALWSLARVRVPGANFH